MNERLERASSPRFDESSSSSTGETGAAYATGFDHEDGNGPRGVGLLAEIHARGRSMELARASGNSREQNNLRRLSAARDGGGAVGQCNLLLGEILSATHARRELLDGTAAGSTSAAAHATFDEDLLADIRSGSDPGEPVAEHLPQQHFTGSQHVALMSEIMATADRGTGSSLNRTVESVPEQSVAGNGGAGRSYHPTEASVIRGRSAAFSQHLQATLARNYDRFSNRFVRRGQLVQQQRRRTTASQQSYRSPAAPGELQTATLEEPTDASLYRPSPPPPVRSVGGSRGALLTEIIATRGGGARSTTSSTMPANANNNDHGHEHFATMYSGTVESISIVPTTLMGEIVARGREVRDHTVIESISIGPTTLMGEIVARGREFEDQRTNRNRERVAAFLGETSRHGRSAMHSSLAQELTEQHETRSEEQEPEGQQMSASNDPSCVVCLELPRTHAFIPCGHRCACRRCAGAVILRSSSSSGLQCPICRRNATCVVKIFL